MMMDSQSCIFEEAAEEPDDPDDFSFEIITEEEIANLACPFSSASMSSSASSASLSSQGSSSSLGSTGMGPTTVIRRSRAPLASVGRTLLTEEELTASARIWYTIQIKGHTHDEDFQNHFDEDPPPSMRKPSWWYNLRHIHEKLKQNAAAKHRFNVNSIPQETREQLKHIYVF